MGDDGLNGSRKYSSQVFVEAALAVVILLLVLLLLLLLLFLFPPSSSLPLLGGGGGGRACASQSSSLGVTGGIKGGGSSWDKGVKGMGDKVVEEEETRGEEALGEA
jgi:hypothetical protein